MKPRSSISSDLSFNGLKERLHNQKPFTQAYAFAAGDS